MCAFAFHLLLCNLLHRNFLGYPIGAYSGRVTWHQDRHLPVRRDLGKFILHQQDPVDMKIFARCGMQLAAICALTFCCSPHVHQLESQAKPAYSERHSWCRRLAAAAPVRPGEHIRRFAACQWKQQWEPCRNAGIAACLDTQAARSFCPDILPVTRDSVAAGAALQAC